MNTSAKPSTSFYIIVIVALLWNLIGIMSFLIDVTMSLEALAAMPEPQRTMYESTPMWLKVIYGLAVICGTFGCILLLMKRSFALPILVISLVAILIQMIYSFTMTNAMDYAGPAGAILPIVVVLIAVFLVWYTYKVKRAGWLR